jgi:hypothetical protein
MRADMLTADGIISAASLFLTCDEADWAETTG